MARTSRKVRADRNKEVILKMRSEGKKGRKKGTFKTRLNNTCSRCGRPRGFMRFFGLCRICVRELASKGEIPGLKKSSW